MTISKTRQELDELLLKEAQARETTRKIIAILIFLGLIIAGYFTYKGVI